MRESIGSAFLYNIIFLFIIIVFGLVIGTLNYYKGFKVNTSILNSVEKYSGYNDYSKKDIDRVLTGLGYSVNSVRCSERKNAKLISSNKNYCLYYYSDDRSNSEKTSDKVTKDGRPIYYSYGVTTFISVELPIVGQFKVPVYTKGERIYRFSYSCQNDGDC